MADRVLPGPVDGTACIREAVCIHTKKIFDSCRAKDCIEDLRVYPTVGSQAYIDAAFSVRPKSAELLYVEVSVEPITFNKGYYTVDVTYFYKINGETFPGANPITGLAIFDKRVMLYGSGAGVKTFNSDPCDYGCEADGLPTPVVESVDPIALHLLRRLVRRTGAGIVLSSSWRYSFEDTDPLIQTIRDHFYRTMEANGTPVRDLAPILGQSKGEEIAAWLDQHPGTSYVILDDRPDEFTRTPALQARLVLVDSMRGLRRADFRQALALLEG